MTPDNKPYGIDRQHGMNDNYANLMTERETRKGKTKISCYIDSVQIPANSLRLIPLDGLRCE